MGRKIVFGLFFLVISFLLSFQLPDKEVKKFYVAFQGKDSNDGSFQKPLASFEAAQQAVRVTKQSGFKGTIEVIVRAGTYYFAETIEFTAEDSGTKLAPIIWKAAEGEKVILSGGKRIKGNWEKGNDGIWVVSVPETMNWKRHEEEAEKYLKRPEMPLNFRELFVNGKRAIRARYPNAQLENPFLYSVANTKNEVQIPVGKIKKSWGDEPDAQINLVPRWRFFNQWNDVTSVDIEKSVIKLGPREQHGEIDKGSWFWIEGVKEELDMPGEWYLNHQEGKLYYKPLQGKSPNDSEIIFPYLNRIFYVKGDVENGVAVKNIQFQGFDFRHTTYTLGQIEARVHTDCAVMFENAQECSIKDCSFSNIGGYALWLHLDSRNNIFDHNTVANSGGGGVLLTGSRFSYMDESKIYAAGEKASMVFPIQNRITRNTVEHCGKIRYYGGGIHIDSRPASMAMAPGNYMAHNHFRDLSRNGIFLFRNQGGNVVEFNEIHDCMQTTIDGAAIHFATMNRLAAPNYIMNNYLYDIWGYEQLPESKPRRTLANGVFLDWATSHTTVANNVIYNAGDREIKPIMGNWNLVIENNLASKTKILPFMPQEIGPNGTASHCIYPEQLRNVGAVITSSDKRLVRYDGKWESKRIAGMRNLFNYDCQQAAPDQSASCTYQLQISEPGMYKVCIMYFPDEKAASNAKITIEHAKGTEKLNWNFRKGDNLGFAISLGEFYFERGKPSNFTISNENADGHIIADGVGIIKQQ